MLKRGNIASPWALSESARLNRRTLLAALLAGPALAQNGSLVTVDGKRPMILYNDRPEDLETPLEHFNSWITPNDVFFVRQHIPRPRLEAAGFQLAFQGRVQKPTPLKLDDLRKLPQVKVAATLECTGNGRAFYRPRVPGIQWGRGAIGNAEWSGPRLSDVLKLAGADLSASYVTANGADVGVAKTPDFIRSLPMKKALHPATLLALDMNSEPVPALHGFPVRLIVPGWDGTSWVKWVTSLNVENEMNKGFFMDPAYRAPHPPVAPGTSADPASLEVIEGMPVKSFITSPADTAKLPQADTTIRGFAWAGENRISRVEVSTDGGERWQDAKLSTQNLPFAWRLWEVPWKPARSGYFNILSRATDSASRIQPVVATWNPSGYLYNAIDRIGVTVKEA